MDIPYGDELQYVVSSLPSWATFNYSTGELSGTPNNSDVELYLDIVVGVKDLDQVLTLFPSFNIEVINTNDPPVITTDGDILAMDQIRAIHKLLPNTHLVMHGSSSVPQELQDIINQYGGNITQTYGVPVEQIQEGIKAGVRKINVDTDNRLAMTGAIRKAFRESPKEFDPRFYLKPARAAMKEVIKSRMISFGQAGQAPNIRRVSLSDFASQYYL